MKMRTGKKRLTRRPDWTAVKNEKGVALVFALLGILILSMLAAALMFVTSTEASASFNYKNQTQAHYAANAGVQRTVNWFKEVYAPWINPLPFGPAAVGPTTYTWTPPAPPRCTTGCSSSTADVTLFWTNADGSTTTNFPDATKVTEFDAMRSTNTSMSLGNTTARFDILGARLLSHERFMALDGVNERVVERWEVQVRGILQGTLGRTTVQETAIISPAPIPIFSNAIHGQCEVRIVGGITTDSYYSTSGPPVTPNLFTGGDAGASVASNSFVNGSGTSGTIHGDLYYGFDAPGCPGTESIDDDVVEGDIIQQPGIPFPPIQPPFTTDSPKVDNCNAAKSPYLFLPKPPTFRFTPNTASDNMCGGCQ
ncbi:MAG: PilX N-terminal domain-containing pilus assembly protein, partial [Gammaproteobacteria bacterium]